MDAPRSPRDVRPMIATLHRPRGALVAALVLAACGGAPLRGPVSGEVEGARFVPVVEEGFDCDHCAGRPSVWIAWRAADGATISVHIDPDLERGDVTLSSHPGETEARAVVAWQGEAGALRATGVLHVEEHTRQRLRGCVEATFDDRGHVAGCFDVALRHTAGYE